MYDLLFPRLYKPTVFKFSLILTEESKFPEGFGDIVLLPDYGAALTLSVGH